MSDNPKLRKNGGKGTFFGNLLRGIVGVGKIVSPQLKTIIESIEGKDEVGDSDFRDIQMQLIKDGFSDNELELLLSELDKDKDEIREVTKRWTSDNKDGGWLARNVRPMTLVLYNLATITFITLDSYTNIGFEVNEQWITLLLSNTGMVNTAYFGSRYFEKRDKKKFK